MAKHKTSGNLKTMKQTGRFPVPTLASVTGQTTAQRFGQFLKRFIKR